MLRNVAHFMQATEKGLSGNIISQNNLETVLIKYLKTIDVNPARKVARLMIDQLRTRNFILCDVGSDYYAFVHRTFLEYFCAWSYIYQLEAQKIDIEYIKTEVFGNHWQNESWHEVLKLIAGMILDPKKVGEIIEYLMAQDGRSANFTNLFLGADCLNEVRNRKLITNVVRNLLSNFKNLIHKIQYKKHNIMQSIKNNSNYQDIDFSNLSELIDDILIKSVNRISIVWHDEPDILPLIKQYAQSNSKGFMRSTAISALARGWHDKPDILPLIRQYAQSDDNRFVRSTAISELAKGWHDELDTLSLIKQYTQSNNDNFVRSTAISELARGWHDEPDTLSLIKQYTQSNNDSFVRSTAISELARGWRDQPDTLLLIKQHAQSDNDSYVRITAIRELANGWHDEIETIELLASCAVKAPFIRKARKWNNYRKSSKINPRQVALEEIVKYFPNHPKTENLLTDRANNDLDKYVRKFAREALEDLSE